MPNEELALFTGNIGNGRDSRFAGEGDRWSLLLRVDRMRLAFGAQNHIGRAKVIDKCQMIEGTNACWWERPGIARRIRGRAAGLMHRLATGTYHAVATIDSRRTHQGESDLILAEIERANGFFAQRILHEFAMASRTKIESKPLVQRSSSVFAYQGLVALKNLCDCLHRIIVQVVLLDLRWVKAGISLNLDHVSAFAGTGQFLAAEIAREVDHQRYIPQL